MLHPSLDALTSATLKHLRERWWDDEFTEFLTEMLRPRAGNRILDVGCGEGMAEVRFGHLHVSQLSLYGVDLVVEQVIRAKAQTAEHNLRARFAAGDARALPFATGVFDSTYCVAVLQHLADADTAVGELARVTRAGGRVVAVEPDISARYWYSSLPTGMQAFQTATQFFTAVATTKGEPPDPAVGPKLPQLFARHGIETLDVRLFPVSEARLGAPGDDVWSERRARVEQALEPVTAPELRAFGREYLSVLAGYEAEAKAAGSSFVEIQNTLLFAAVGQRD